MPLCVAKTFALSGSTIRKILDELSESKTLSINCKSFKTAASVVPDALNVGKPEVVKRAMNEASTALATLRESFCAKSWLDATRATSWLIMTMQIDLCSTSCVAEVLKLIRAIAFGAASLIVAPVAPPDDDLRM